MSGLIENLMLDGELLTPCYVINAERFERNLECFKDAFVREWNGTIKYGYSIKTNHSQTFLRLAKKNGMLAEAVSDDEYNLAVELGYAPKEIIFNGPQKSRKQLIFALENGGIINLDNEDELRVIENCGENALNKNTLIGLRVNFDLERQCPNETTAGSQVSRFGFCVENGEFSLAVRKLHDLGIPISGLHMHYSSKTRSTNVFCQLAREASRLIDEFSLQDEIRFIDIGGGFFLGDNKYAMGKPSMEEYAKVITNELKKVLCPEKVCLILEPGASLISTAVDYYTRVINERTIRDTKILTVDGSNIHINPFMINRNVDYNVHFLNKQERRVIPKQIVCGATCMENDRLVSLDESQEILAGDILECHFAGAYTMGFNSCFINLPPREYVKNGDKIMLVRDKNFELMRQI